MNRTIAFAALSIALLLPSASLGQPPGMVADQPRVNTGRLDGSIKSYQDATKYYQAGQYKQAEMELEKFLAAVGEHAGGNFMMGLVQIGLQDIEKARTSFRAAVKSDPSMVAPRGYLGAVEAFLGNPKSAIEQKTALEKMATECGGNCPKAADITQALQRVEENLAAAAQPQPS